MISTRRVDYILSFALVLGVRVLFLQSGQKLFALILIAVVMVVVATVLSKKRS